MTGLSPVVLLDGTHELAAFSCGHPEMDEWLVRYALTNQRLSATRTYVTCQGKAVKGYYSLAPSSIEFQNVPERFQKGLARYPVPVILLARLAVDEEFQGRKVGESLLLEALHRSLAASKAIGGLAVLVHAIDERARGFYERFDFEQSPTNPFHLLLLMSELEATFA